MMLKHRLLASFVILSGVLVLGGANAQSTTRSFSAKKHYDAIQVRHPLYNSYTRAAPVVPVVNPGCYLPSDGCPNEYSVQN
jgi:hypothetical protein